MERITDTRVQVSMQNPKYFHLSAPTDGSRLICEVLERSDPISCVLPLLEAHGLRPASAPDCPVICKDSAGVTIATNLSLEASMQQVEEALAAALVCFASLA
jgi:hypothetical protein